MWERTKNFVARLQSSPEPVRRHWVIGLSTGTGIIVVALWISYINVIVKPTSEPVAAATEPGFTATFGKGVSIVLGEAKKGGGQLSGSVKELLGNSNEILFERPKEDFILDGLAPVPKTKIP